MAGDLCEEPGRFEVDLVSLGDAELLEVGAAGEAVVGAIWTRQVRLASGRGSVAQRARR
jgi:hypothetical protein